MRSEKEKYTKPRSALVPTKLHSSGLKVTIPRMKILEALQRSKAKHLSADDVYRLMRDEQMDVSFPTIYRVLMQFTEARILNRLHLDEDRAVFELNEGDHHDHLICVSCGRVEEFLDPEIERHQSQIAKKYRFTLQDHSLSLYGLCEKCTKFRKPQAPVWSALKKR